MWSIEFPPMIPWDIPCGNSEINEWSIMCLIADGEKANALGSIGPNTIFVNLYCISKIGTSHCFLHMHMVILPVKASSIHSFLSPFPFLVLRGRMDNRICPRSLEKCVYVFFFFFFLPSIALWYGKGHEYRPLNPNLYYHIQINIV